MNRKSSTVFPSGVGCFLMLMFPIVFCAPATATAQEKPASVTASPTTPAQLKTIGDDLGDTRLLSKTARRGVDYLLQKGQAEDGSFSKQLSPAVTALCISALLEHGVSVANPRVQKGLKFLESIVKQDGGIYAKGSNLRNYETSVSIMCFKRANASGKYSLTIERAVGFLKGIQWDEGENHGISSKFYGGQGYGKHKRPDLSNTSYFIDALNAAKEDKDSEAFKKARVFLSRCQNLPSKDNSAEFALRVSKEDKGGMIYSPVGKGETKVEKPGAKGGLRSYGSMTYAGLKSMLYAGISPDDVRVKAAQDWISRNYDVKTNPGMGKQGLFYYYHVFGKTMAATGQSHVVTSDGKRHDWRKDLITELNRLQQSDGSWTNPSDRWYEGDPNLVTAYTLLALSYCDSPKPAKK